MDMGPHVLLQLPIQPSRLELLLHPDDMHGTLEYNPDITEPEPYEPWDSFAPGPDAVPAPEPAAPSTPRVHCQATPAVPDEAPVAPNCFWCCHPVHSEIIGMPIQYDVVHQNFSLYGTFCSLECAAAMNFSMHMGSDRAWEIHSWIQVLGRRYGHPLPVRPAPSRYLLRMFEGPLSIDEFRRVHRSTDRTYVLHVPPFVAVQGQMDALNTSFMLQGASAPAAAPKRAVAPRPSVPAFGPAKGPGSLGNKMNLRFHEEGPAPAVPPPA